MEATNSEQWAQQALEQFATEIWTCNTIERATSFLGSRKPPVCLPNYVAGGLSPPQSQLTAPLINSFDPKTGSLLCKLPCTPASDVEAAIQHARHAFTTWSKTTRRERSSYLRRISDLLQEHRELFAVWESIDQGKTLERARMEVDRAISNFS